MRLGKARDVTPKTLTAAALALLTLAACGEPDVILPGERFAIRPEDQVVNRAVPISLPAARVNADWTHRAGDADHRVVHPALAGLNQIFAVPIGEGDSLRARINGDPVVANGAIYAMDSRGRVSAISTAGQPLWSTAVPTGLDNRSDASGGGLAVAGSRLFATSGFGALVALDARTGAILWEQDLDAPGTSAPTVAGGLVYVVGRDNTGWAVDAETGRVSWQVSGIPSVSSFAGGAGAAVSGDLVVFPLDSGEIIGSFPQGGLQRWSTVLSGAREGSAAIPISDIGGDPVIDGGRVYLANVSGRTVALDTFSGERIWTAGEGAVSPVWPTGGSVFLVSDRNELVRLDAATGATIWKVGLPDFIESGWLRKRRDFFAHYGPVLAGGRLIVAGSDGQLRAFDPASGALVASVPLPGGAASNPVVAGGTLYVVSKSGQLVAYR